MMHPQDAYEANKWGPWRRAWWRWRKWPKHRNTSLDVFVTLAIPVGAALLMAGIPILVGYLINQ